MTSTHRLTLLTPRDRDVLLALDRCPLTIRQLLALSETFAYPFTTERRVQERLARLCAAGRLRRWHYATAGPGALSYYTLSPLGFRLLYGHDAPPPRSRAFSAVGVAREAHTRALADFLVHTLVGASRAGVSITDFRRENALRLELDGDDCLHPDAAFAVTRPDGVKFRYFVELDNASERIRSQTNLDSWERKIRFYDAYQDRIRPARFHVLAVTTGTTQRLVHILGAARAIVRNPFRSLIYGITLANYVDEMSPLTTACLRDNCGRRVMLVLPARTPTRVPTAPTTALAPAAAL